MDKPFQSEFADLKKIANDPQQLHEYIQHLKDYESHSQLTFNVREYITGPMIDCLFEENQMICKKLKDGTRINFYYRSKIGRDFLLSDEDYPDHVWEPQTTRLMRFLAKDSKHFIIGGAHFGDQAILVATANPDCYVHAFEPDDIQSYALNLNILENHLQNISQHHHPLWKLPEVAMCPLGYDAYASYCSTHENTHLLSESIDNYTKDLFCIDVISLDVEGGEFDALLGAHETLQRDRPTIIFEVHAHFVDFSKGLSETSIVQYLQNLGYSLFAIRDYNSNIVMPDSTLELIPLDSIYLKGPPHGFNLLALYDMNRLDKHPHRIVEGLSPKLIRGHKNSLHQPSMP